MRVIALVTIASALALAGCDKNEQETPYAPGGPVFGSADTRSSEQVASVVRKVSLEPGEWQTTSEIIDLTVENAPQGMPAGMMNAMRGRKVTVKTCITPEQANRPDADFLTAQKDNNCRYKGFRMSGGAV